MTKTSCPKCKKSKNVLEILVSKPFIQNLCLASCFMSIFGNDNSNFQKSKARWITAGCLETAEWKYGSCSKRLGHEISPSVVSWIPARLFREEGDFVAHICGFPSGEGWTSVTGFRAYHSAVQSRQHVYYFDYAACTQNLESWTPRDNDCFLPPR